MKTIQLLLLLFIEMVLCDENIEFKIAYPYQLLPDIQSEDHANIQKVSNQAKTRKFVLKNSKTHFAQIVSKNIKDQKVFVENNLRSQQTLSTTKNPRGKLNKIQVMNFYMFYWALGLFLILMVVIVWYIASNKKKSPMQDKQFLKQQQQIKFGTMDLKKSQTDSQDSDHEDKDNSLQH